MGRILGWIFIILIVFLLIGAGGIIFFISRFNPNDYRPLIESKLSENLQLKVEIGRLSTNWYQGLAVKANEIKISSRKGAVPFLSIDSFFLQFNPFSLLSGKLVFSDFRLVGPKVLLIRSRDGLTNWEKTAPKVVKPAAKPKNYFEKIAAGLVILFSKAIIQDGSFHFRDESQAPSFEIPIEGIQAQIQLSGTNIRTKGEGRWLDPAQSDFHWEGVWQSREQEADFNLSFRGKQFSTQGKVAPFQKPVRFQGVGDLNGLVLDQGPLTGRVDGHVEFEGSGQNEEEIKKSILAKGKVEIHDGVFHDVNLIRSLFARITIIPGLNEVITSVLPPRFQPLFNEPDTHFESLQTEFNAQGNQVALEPFLLKGDDYLIDAQGNLGLEGNFDLHCQLILMEELSDFLIHRLKELSYLKNSQERIVIPFVLRGTWPRIFPEPDLVYLGERLVVDQGTKLLQKGLEILSERGKQEGQ